MAPREFFFKLLGVGWFVGICIVGGALGGWFLDKAVDTKPLFTLVFLTLGTVFAMYMVWRWLSPGVKRPIKPDEDKDKEHD
jgi:F0F1-type ATP synthase assembly protein I